MKITKKQLKQLIKEQLLKGRGGWLLKKLPSGIYFIPQSVKYSIEDIIKYPTFMTAAGVFKNDIVPSWANYYIKPNSSRKIVFLSSEPELLSDSTYLDDIEILDIRSGPTTGKILICKYN